MNRFSIILPVKNGGEYVKECVHSILAQDFEAFNLHVLNNQSTDGTLEWLQSLNDDRIIIHNSEKNLSMPENWARALSIPLNEFITFIGHDDVYQPDYLQTINNLIQQHPDASIYQTHFNYINAQGAFVRLCLPMPQKILVEDFLKFQFLQSMDSMGTGYMFRSKDFKRLGGFPANYPNLIFGDYQLFVELTGLSYLAVSKEGCFKYRLHQSLSKTTRINDYCTAFSIYLRFLANYQTEKVGVKHTIQRYGRNFFNFYCQSLSHRLLKSNEIANRSSVDEFVQQCKRDAGILEVKKFNPNHVFKIWIAKVLDRYSVSRGLFNSIRKILQ